MKIWLPDSTDSIDVDTPVGNGEPTVYQHRIRMTLQPAEQPKGFEKKEDDAVHK